MHVIAAKAVAFGEALRPSFKLYARNVVENAKALAETLKSHGLDIVSGGTDTHLMLVDLRPKKPDRQGGGSWRSAAPTSPATRTASRSTREKPTITSGIRLGTPAGTTRGFGIAEFREVGEMIVEVLDVLVAEGRRGGFADRSRGARQGEGIAVAVSDLSIIRFRSPDLRGRVGGARGTGGRHALPELREPRYPGEGFAADRGLRGRSAAAASASPAISASPPSSACSCAS